MLLGLGPVRWIEGAPMIRGLRRQTFMFQVDLEPGAPVGPVLDAVEARKAKVRRAELGREREVRRVRIEVELPANVEMPQIVDDLSRLEDVIAVRTES